ncbi:hypothetical protein ABEB36_015095 [Hypothenemus hampei]|uniref:Uncharacterized protein n=1 Tax=Hypothenemus hampei TaxID=57062 RepID=A0ABD1E0G2_HYPHA
MRLKTAKDIDDGLSYLSNTMEEYMEISRKYGEKTKDALNAAIKKLKRELIARQNSSIQQYTSQLTHLQDSYDLIWKLIRNIKRPMPVSSPLRGTGDWIVKDKEKSEEFANHLKKKTFTNKAILDLPIAL